MEPKKLIYLHASRGRPELALEAITSFIASMKSGIPFSYVLSLDEDDPKLPKYMELFKDKDFVKKIVVSANTSVVPATNKAAEYITDEDLIFNLSDDFQPTPFWDVLMLDFIKEIPTEEYLVHIGDGHQFRMDCAIIQILSTALYRKLGFIFYPGYKSMYADNDLYHTARAMGVAYTCRKFYIYHSHPGFGDRPWDDTYTREDSGMAFGEEMFRKRSAENFGV